MKRLLKNGDKVGIVSCSNAQKITEKQNINLLISKLKQIGLVPVCSNHIFEKYSVFSGSGKERAESLMEFYMDKSVQAIFDISGGDLSNELLSYLDYEGIKQNPKPFFGYSDLTTIINALYTKCGVESYLYQIRNFLYDYGEQQLSDFENTFLKGYSDLFQVNWRFLQGSSMKGTIIGGNIRCFLKLAGTPYLPDFQNKILFLESYGGEGSLNDYLFEPAKTDECV